MVCIVDHLVSHCDLRTLSEDEFLSVLDSESDKQQEADKGQESPEFGLVCVLSAVVDCNGDPIVVKSHEFVVYGLHLVMFYSDLSRLNCNNIHILPLLPI